MLGLGPPGWGAHALSELKNVKNPTVMGTKYAWKKVKVNRVYF